MEKYEKFGCSIADSLRSETDETRILISYQLDQIFGQKQEPLLKDFNES